MMRLFDKFRAKQPITAVPASWFNSLAGWFNHLRGEGVGCEVTVTKPDNPSDSNPPLIRVKVLSGGNASLSDATPRSDTVAGSAGTGTKASRDDHSHPINVNDTADPADIGPPEDVDPGTSDNYARADHVHAIGDDAFEEIIDYVETNNSGYPPLDYELKDTYTAMPFVEGNLAADQTTWAEPTPNTGLTIGVVTRVRYEETDDPPHFRAYYRKLWFDTHGRLMVVSTEGSYPVFIPVRLNI